jgi:hypothetical protein
MDMSDAEHAVAVQGFVALWHGQRPTPADPAIVAGLHQRGLVELDADGLITGIHGLSTTPTAHRIIHDGRTIHTWCAFDAVGIPAALGLDALAETSCPTCGQHLDITFAHGRPTARTDVRLWLPTGRCEHVMNDLCAHANLYCNREHLTATVPGTALTVAEAARLGATTWRDAGRQVSASTTGVPSRRRRAR